MHSVLSRCPVTVSGDSLGIYGEVFSTQSVGQNWSPSRQPNPQSVDGVTIEQAWDRYLAHPSSARTPKTIMAYETVKSLVVSILGADFLVTNIHRQGCRRVLTVLQRLPTSYGKRWKGMSSEAIADLATKQGLKPMSAANCNGYMSRWSGTMNWLVKEELTPRNPCVGLRVADPIPAREKRRPFSDQQLQRIFTGKPFAEIESICKGNAQPDCPAHFYVPLIALFSGLRQNEICQQTTDDIVHLDGILCFVVKADTALGKRVKTSPSERIVPAHPTLISAQLLRHWRGCVRSGQARLWAELELDRFGYASAYFSKWFGRYLTKTGAKEERTSFHSFRHCFRDSSRAGRVERELAFALGGWSGGRSGNVAVGDIYASGFGVKALYNAVSKVRYEAPALKRLLKRVD